jgi:hypothetical protein
MFARPIVVPGLPVLTSSLLPQKMCVSLIATPHGNWAPPMKLLSMPEPSLLARPMVVPPAVPGPQFAQ